MILQYDKIQQKLVARCVGHGHSPPVTVPSMFLPASSSPPRRLTDEAASASSSPRKCPTTGAMLAGTPARASRSTADRALPCLSAVAPRPPSPSTSSSAVPPSGGWKTANNCEQVDGTAQSMGKFRSIHFRNLVFGWVHTHTPTVSASFAPPAQPSRRWYTTALATKKVSPETTPPPAQPHPKKYCHNGT